MTMKITRQSWDTNPVERELTKQGKDALVAAGKKTLELAGPTTPRDKGDLASSGKVELSDDGTVQIGYSAPYAVIQHEDTAYHHAGSGRAKWFQLTLQEKAASIFAEMARRIHL